jgi:hypothetical protein
MTVHRRQVLGGLGFAAAAVLRDLRTEAAGRRTPQPARGFPRKADFLILEPFFPPNLPAGEYVPVTYDLQKNATGMFESGTLAGGPAMNIALLAASLNYVLSLGVANIQAHRQPLSVYNDMPDIERLLDLLS